MNDEQSSRLAQAIADGRKPDWSSAEPDELRTGAYRLLNDIAASFRVRRSAHLGEKREPLFTWRHLEAIEEIGSGAFGQVFRAYDPVLCRDVALKLARDDADRRLDPGVVIAEARSMARLRHPNILAVHGADEDAGRVGIWCDLLEGRTLAQVLDELGRVPPPEALGLAVPLADALVLIHRRGLCHGDIKPANIMIQPDGTPVLMDFGAARDALGSVVTAGSPLFMAPEAFGAGAASSQEADIYAFGVLLFRLLSGRHPIEASSLDELIRRHEQGAEPNLRDLPRGFRGPVADCLARDPVARPHAEALLDRLQALERAPAVRRRRLAIGAIFASLLVGLLAAGIGLLRALESERLARLERNKAASTLEFVENMLEAPSMLNKGPELKVVDLLDAAARELETLPPDDRFVAGPVHLILGRTYRSLDQNQAARRQLTAALELLRGEPDADPDEILDVRTDLAVIEFFLDRPEQADAQFEEIRADAEAFAGKDGLPYLRATFRQGEIAIGRGDFATAIELLEEAQQGSSALPADEELRPRIQTKLAQLYAVSGRMEAAEQLAREALEWELDYRGEATIPGTILRNSLAIVLNHKGEYAQAETHLRAGLAALDRIAPGPSRIRSGLQANLANSLNGQGRFQASVDVNKEILEAYRSGSEPNWRRIIDVTGNIGGSYLGAGDYEEARKWLVEATQLGVEKMGAESTAFLYPAVSLCSLYLEIGELDRALSYCAETGDTAGAALGQTHLLSFQAKGHHGAALVRSGDVQTGLASLEETVGAMREQLGTSNPSTLDIEVFLIEALMAAGREQEAVDSAEALLAARRDVLAQGHPAIREAENLLERAKHRSATAD